MSSVLESYGLIDEVSTDATSEETGGNNKDVGRSADDGEEKEDSSGELGSETDSTEGTETGDIQPEKKESKTVKSIEDKLTEEIGFRSRLQRELKDAKEQLNSFSELKSRFDELRGELKATSKENTEELNYEDSPLEYLKNQIQGLQETIRGLVQHTDNNVQITEHQKYINSLLAKGNKSFNSFGEENGDFSDAMVFLRENRLKQFGAMGYSDEESNQLLTNDVLAILDRSYKGEQNPAEVIYQIAKINGFKSKSNAKETLKKAAKGQDKNKTISDSGTGAEKDTSLMTLEDLAGMNDQDFDKYWNQTIKNKRLSS